MSLGSTFRAKSVSEELLHNNTQVHRYSCDSAAWLEHHHARHWRCHSSFSRMRSEGFLFLGAGPGAGLCLTRFRHVCAERSRTSAACSRRVRFGVAIGRYNSACLERVAACVRVDVSRGRRGGMVDDACVKKMADERVAWQAWGSGCMSAFGGMLGSGSAWQVW